MSGRTAFRIEPAEIEHRLDDGQELDFARGLRVLFTPGHSTGHIVFFWPENGGVLFAGDAAAHWMRLGCSPIYEDLAQSRRSLARLGALKFVKADFGHGKSVRSATVILKSAHLLAAIQQYEVGEF